MEKNEEKQMKKDNIREEKGKRKIQKECIKLKDISELSKKMTNKGKQRRMKEISV